VSRFVLDRQPCFEQIREENTGTSGNAAAVLAGLVRELLLEFAERSGVHLPLRAIVVGTHPLADVWIVNSQHRVTSSDRTTIHVDETVMPDFSSTATDEFE
jgi:hypothetical protein